MAAVEETGSKVAVSKEERESIFNSLCAIFTIKRKNGFQLLNSLKCGKDDEENDAVNVFRRMK